MSLTVTSVVTDMSADIRAVLGFTGNDLALAARWVDRIQKDLLHTSVYKHAISAVEAVSTTAGTASYLMSTTTLRQIDWVYDRTFSNTLEPVDLLIGPNYQGFPNPGPNPQPAEQVRTDAALRMKTSTPWPQYYKLQSVVTTGTFAQTLYLFPAPATSTWESSIEVHYRKFVPSVSAGADVLTVPEDARDLIVAGVNWLASAYLKRPEDAAMWMQAYKEMKIIA